MTIAGACSLDWPLLLTLGVPATILVTIAANVTIAIVTVAIVTIATHSEPPNLSFGGLGPSDQEAAEYPSLARITNFASSLFIGRDLNFKEVLQMCDSVNCDVLAQWSFVIVSVT